MSYIPIGGTCSVAYQLQEHKLRKYALPFDWLKTSFDEIINCLKYNFEGFCSFEKLKLTDKFPYLEGDEFIKSTKSTYQAINKYKMSSFHDFSADIPFEDQLIIVKKKYDRRIKRLYGLLNSTDKLIFIRDESKPHSINKSNLMTFINIIKKINPLIDFKLIIILHNPKKTHPLLDYKSKYVDIIINETKFGNWTRPNINWENIFVYS